MSPDEADNERRRRLRERVFGEVLPETTTDERETDDSTESADDWLKRQVPPHHG